MSNEIENKYKVKLAHPVSRNRRVVFDVTPDLVETRNVNYKSLDPVHTPGQIYVYGNTSSRTFNLSNVRLISRTKEEAEENLKRLQILRTWTLPVFGQSTLDVTERGERKLRADNPGYFTPFSSEEERVFFLGEEMLGAPPDVIFLSAYSDTPTGGRPASQSGFQLEHIRRVPVVLQQLSIPYPSDVDYIPTTSGVPMPTIMTIDMVLLETHSPREYSKFSLQNYRKGILKGF